MTWADVSPDSIRQVVAQIGDDGHTIYDPCVLESAPEELRARSTGTYKSGRGKHAISDRAGNRVETCEGVYGGAVLATIVRDLGLQSSSCRGRGSAACQDTDTIRQWLAAFGDH